MEINTLVVAIDFCSKTAAC